MASQRLFPLSSELRQSQPGTRLPVLKPQLPSAACLLPYLESIDERRWYSNAGHLVTQLEEQLSRKLGFAGRGVVAAANATIGITVALLARRVPANSLCILPSWTFVATPHAV